MLSGSVQGLTIPTYRINAFRPPSILRAKVENPKSLLQYDTAVGLLRDCSIHFNLDIRFRRRQISDYALCSLHCALCTLHRMDWRSRVPPSKRLYTPDCVSGCRPCGSCRIRYEMRYLHGHVDEGARCSICIFVN